MRFRNDDLPVKSELTDTVAEEHPKRFVDVAEEQIKAMHSHEDGSAVELHQVGSREFISQSIASSLEGKIGNSEFWDENKSQQPQPNNFAAARIEYEKKSSQNQPTQLYGSQQSVTGAALHSQETALVGCNCGLEWTVTGQSAKAQGAEGVKIEQYGNTAGKDSAPGYASGGGGGGGPGEYRAGGGQQQGYKG